MNVERIKSVIIFCLICLLLFQNLINNSSSQCKSDLKEVIKINPKSQFNIDLKNIIKTNIDDFRKIGLKHGTDKIFYHHYESLYGTHIGPFRSTSINFLEIGIGCGMGPGKSILTWKEYMPMADIYAMEFDASCAEPFRKQVKEMFIGDQSDLNLLRKVGEQVGHFDVIVDDGGHSRKQQVNSLIGLWPFLSKGGVYVIEDMYHSFVDKKSSVNKWYSGFNDNDESSIDLIMELIILFNDPLEIEWIQNMNAQIIKPNISIRTHASDISKSLHSINCYKRACVLHKN